MPRLPSISARECIIALEKTGFYVVRQRGSHLILRRDHPRTRVVVPNHKALKRGLLRGIIRQAGLTVEQFLELL